MNDGSIARIIKRAAGNAGQANYAAAKAGLKALDIVRMFDGKKIGIDKHLDEALKTRPPLEIINGPLMDGMREVGRLFNDNELIVAEVLQSAEAMKAAVGHLQKFMEKTTDSLKGKIVLATVKGDVHDIGKNLVEIILKNNGYRIVNLGIKVPPEELIAGPAQSGLVGDFFMRSARARVPAPGPSRGGSRRAAGSTKRTICITAIAGKCRPTTSR